MTDRLETLWLLDDAPQYSAYEAQELERAAVDLQKNSAFIETVNESRRAALRGLLAAKPGTPEALEWHADLRATENFVARLKYFGHNLTVLRSKAR